MWVLGNSVSSGVVNYHLDDCIVGIFFTNGFKRENAMA